ncbi:MAG: Acetyltransferase domain, partial [Clostridia bacterium]|nr:Acetyltransferase domain [Clostridia bacterium]
MIIDNVKNSDELNTVMDLIFTVFPEYNANTKKEYRDCWQKRLIELPELLIYAKDCDIYCGFTFAWDDNGIITISFCGVDFSYRGKGIGKSLITEAEKRIKLLGYHGIALGAVETAKGFYKKLGYTGSLLIQSEQHSIEELMSLNTTYEVIYTNVYDSTINQVCLRVSAADRELQ